MKGRIDLTFQSRVELPSRGLWERINTFRRLNTELFPVLRMTCPAGFEDKPLEEFPVDRVAFSSTVLLLRILPIDRYRVRMLEVIPEAGFIESSESLFASRWRHSRSIAGKGEASVVIDRLEVDPRCPLSRPFVSILIRIIFGNRHKRLKGYSASSSGAAAIMPNDQARAPDFPLTAMIPENKMPPSMKAMTRHGGA